MDTDQGTRAAQGRAHLRRWRLPGRSGHHLHLCESVFICGYGSETPTGHPARQSHNQNETSGTLTRRRYRGEALAFQVSPGRLGP